MKILYFSQFFYPENAAGAFRATENAKIWNDKGNDITIFTTYPNFPTGKIFDGYNNSLLNIENINNIKVLRSKIYCPKKQNKMNKILSYLSYSFFAIINFIINRKHIGKDFDIVLGTSGTIFNALIAYIYSLIIKKDFIFEIRDITFIQIKAVFGEKSFLEKVVKGIELFLCKKSKKVIVVTKGFKKILIDNNINKDKIDIIYNGVKIDEKDENLNVETNNKNCICFSYIGNIGKSQNLEEIIKVFIKLNIINSKLILVGEGADKDNLLKKFSNNKNIDFIDGMNKNSLKKYYEITDIAIVSLKNNENFKYTIPSKIFENMYNKKFILFFGPDGEAANIIKKANCGLIFCENILNEKVLLEIKNIVNDRKKMNFMAKQGYEYVKLNFNRDMLAQHYIDILKN